MKIARNEKGFTLIELMVVLIIIGVLAAIAIPLMSKQTDKAKVKRAVSELKSMKTIVDIYMADSNINPTAVAPSDDKIKEVLTNGGVTTEGLKDPWGNGYIYVRGADPFKTYTIYSKGPDPSTAGDEITVTNEANPKEAQNNSTAGKDVSS